MRVIVRRGESITCACIIKSKKIRYVYCARVLNQVEVDIMPNVQRPTGKRISVIVLCLRGTIGAKVVRRKYHREMRYAQIRGHLMGLSIGVSHY